MTDAKIAALMNGIAPVLREFVEKALAPVIERQAALQARLEGLPQAATAAELAALARAHNEVREMVLALPPVPTAEEVAALIPAPKDGRDGVDGKDGGKGEKGDPGAPGKDGRDGERGADGIDGKDGVGLAGALIDRDGVLTVTMTDGSLTPLGIVVGKDGERGRDGADGIGFDDLEVVDDGTTFTLRFMRGEQGREFTLAKPTLADCYRGVWREGAYKAGDAVTWGGSLWIAQRDTEAKPESNDDFRLAVKRGRDGKDGVMAEPKPPSPVKLK